MECVFETYLNQEPSQSDAIDIPFTKEPVWILGKKYNPIQGKYHLSSLWDSSIAFYHRKITNIL